ncbi:hypothetical protein ABIE67_009799 [Streptomyces sp. V4I8]
MASSGSAVAGGQSVLGVSAGGDSGSRLGGPRSSGVLSPHGEELGAGGVKPAHDAAAGGQQAAGPIGAASGQGLSASAGQDGKASSQQADGAKASTVAVPALAVGGAKSGDTSSSASAVAAGQQSTSVPVGGGGDTVLKDLGGFRESSVLPASLTPGSSVSGPREAQQSAPTLETPAPAAPALNTSAAPAAASLTEPAAAGGGCLWPGMCWGWGLRLRLLRGLWLGRLRAGLLVLVCRFPLPHRLRPLARRCRRVSPLLRRLLRR